MTWKMIKPAQAGFFVSATAIAMTQQRAGNENFSAKCC
jgi:hypothetical protein